MIGLDPLSPDVSWDWLQPPCDNAQDERLYIHKVMDEFAVSHPNCHFFKPILITDNPSSMSFS